MKQVLVAGVMGCPVEHSLSPEIFEFLGKRLKKPLIYKKIHVEPKDLEQTLAILGRSGVMTGWNVTLPHKETIVSGLDQLCGESRFLKSVNVVQVQKGQLCGWNTDWIGVYKSLQEHQEALKGTSALIFGAGGAAVSVVYALGRLGVSTFYIVNRDRQRAAKLIRRMKLLVPSPARVAWKILSFAQARVCTEEIYACVNTTPMGMRGVASDLFLPPQMHSQGFCFDLIYRPAQTDFLKLAGKKKIKAIGGLEMLIWQAFAAWELWVGPLSRQQALQRALKDELKRRLDPKCV